MRSRISVFLFMIISSIILLNTGGDRHGHVFKWDKSSYHLHLPAAIIYHDITKLEFYHYIDEVYHPSDEAENYGIYKLDNGNRINRYNIGVAVMELPFFLVAHFINITWLHYPADGYSLPYEWDAVLSNLSWTILGLFYTRKFLLRHFSDNVAAITLLAISFGTNLYYYAIFSGGGTHCYSFFLFAAILYWTDSLYGTGKKKYFYLLALGLGLVGITRVSNLLVVLIPLLWEIKDISSISKRLEFIKKNTGPIALSLAAFVAVMMLQLGYWKYITGQWLYDGYPDEGFLWGHPAIWKGLFSFQKGWFIYTPMAVFAIWGIYSMRKKYSAYIIPLTVFMIVNVYIIFSWWNWWYGGCFGCRPLVESMALLSLPFAAFIEQVARKKRRVQIVTGIVLLLLTGLNMFQSYQYDKGVLHWERMSAAYYSRVFLELKATDEDRTYLMPEREFYGEMERRLNGLHRDKQ